MKFPRLGLFFGIALLLVTAGAQAEPKKKGLGPFSGSYTGTAISSVPAGTLSNSSTLTFTGKDHNLHGTFLYNGILASGTEAKNVQHTLTISSRGILSGRASVDGVEGYATGQVRLSGRKMAVSITYFIGPGPEKTISLVGGVTFKNSRSAVWTADVTSSDPTYNGSLLVTGKR